MEENTKFEMFHLPKDIAEMYTCNGKDKVLWVKELLQKLVDCLSYAIAKWAMFPELVKVLS
jgi:hypothetical protein